MTAATGAPVPQMLRNPAAAMAGKSKTNEEIDIITVQSPRRFLRK
jgi:hypothetical protein